MNNDLAPRPAPGTDRPRSRPGCPAPPVVMALLTTVATGPPLTLLDGKSGQPGQGAAAPPAHMDPVGAASGPSDEHRVS